MSKIDDEFAKRFKLGNPVRGIEIWQAKYGAIRSDQPQMVNGDFVEFNEPKSHFS